MNFETIELGFQNKQVESRLGDAKYDSRVQTPVSLLVVDFSMSSFITNLIRIKFFIVTGKTQPSF